MFLQEAHDSSQPGGGAGGRHPGVSGQRLFLRQQRQTVTAAQHQQHLVRRQTVKQQQQQQQQQQMAACVSCLRKAQALAAALGVRGLGGMTALQVAGCRQPGS